MTQPNSELNSIGTGRFFRKLDWSAFWTACIISFAVYLYTLAPTVTLEDSGELAVASDYLGVPHPPGYPIWTLITWLFTKIFSFVTFRGQPNPAWSVGLTSAVFGALATGMTAMLISRSGSHLLQGTKRTSYTLKPETENAICWVSGVAASLLFAFSPVMWSQSVIVEVYSLNAFFLVLVFLLTYRWLCRPSDNVLYATAFIFGLGLTNYQVLLLAGLPIVMAVFLKDLELFRDFLVLGSVYLLVLILIRFEFLPAIRHPMDQFSAIYMLLNLVILILACFILPRGKTVALTFFLLQLGVAFYGLMPIVSDLRNPPMNWAYPRTWNGFTHAITRGQYEKIKPAEVLSPKFLKQIGSYLTDLRMQFTLPVALLGFLPFAMWDVRIGKQRHKIIHLAIALALVASFSALVEEIFFVSGQLGIIYKPLVAMVLVLGAIGAGTTFVNMGNDLVDKLRGKAESSLSERILAAFALLATVLLYTGFVAMVIVKIRSICEPLGVEGKNIPQEQLSEILHSSLFYGALTLLPLVIAAAIIWLNKGPLKTDMTLDRNAQKWMMAILLGFLSLSIVLIVLADPSGDIQDSFIQRVKFISSHALFALWIGYGLVFGLSFVDRFSRGNQLVKTGSIVVAACLAFIPIRENYQNPELARRIGGAEQNGHDFGWQFGNYQLRGAEAILEEISHNEEPPPNPSYPPPMSQNAVFFGGTDPGRFVPTYMIYSARVREDVYLITQNALADNTYLNVMRDLYGDQIWIPAEVDSARAFNQYVQDVQSGRKKPTAGIQIQNGRVQITGALGVMEINGILAKMIFDYNNYKHDFYVEESYVLDWMYPYMTPHGLIMKINTDRIQGGIPAENINNDLDFWDWYTKRLIMNPKFRRDVVARKSFSKLRSAIAGLYAHSNRSKPRQSEQAFHEARVLYPLSPEANFRLTQEIYWPQMRMDNALDLMSEFASMDQANTKAEGFVKRLGRVRNQVNKINILEKELGKKPDNMNNQLPRILELADLYLKAQFMPQFMNLMNQVASNTNLPSVYHFKAAELLFNARQYPMMIKALDQCIGRLPENVPAQVYLRIITFLAKARRPDKMEPWMNIYVEKKPEDSRAFLDLAKVRLAINKKEEAKQALQRAIEVGGNNAINVIQKDQSFKNILPARPRKIKPNIFLPETKRNTKNGFFIPGNR